MNMSHCIQLGGGRGGGDPEDLEVHLHLVGADSKDGIEKGRLVHHHVYPVHDLDMGDHNLRGNLACGEYSAADKVSHSPLCPGTF